MIVVLTSTHRRQVGAQVEDVLVLVSGGIDSAACAAYFQKQGFAVAGLFVDYGQVSRAHEAAAAAAVAGRMGFSLTSIAVSGLPPLAGNIRGRNAALVILGLMAFRSAHGILSLGIHAGTPYEDCSADFVRAAQDLLDVYAAGRIRLNAPFLSLTKQDVWDFACGAGVPLDLTYSCETGGPMPCGLCPSCRDREAVGAR